MVRCCCISVRNSVAPFYVKTLIRVCRKAYILSRCLSSWAERLSDYENKKAYLITFPLLCPLSVSHRKNELLVSNYTFI